MYTTYIQDNHACIQLHIPRPVIECTTLCIVYKHSLQTFEGTIMTVCCQDGDCRSHLGPTQKHYLEPLDLSHCRWTYNLHDMQKRQCVQASIATVQVDRCLSFPCNVQLQLASYMLLNPVVKINHWRIVVRIHGYQAYSEALNLGRGVLVSVGQRLYVMRAWHQLNMNYDSGACQL